MVTDSLRLPYAATLTLEGARPEDARLLGSGWNADAWLVHAVDGEWVVRIPRNAWAGGEIERQTCLAPKLAAHGIPVPAGYAVVRDENGKTIAGVYRYVAGEQAPRTGPLLRRLAPVVADLLERIHAVPAGDALACGAEELDPWEGRWRPIVARHARDLPPKTRAWVEAATARLEVLCRVRGKPVLIHGDLQPEHLLLGGDGALAAVLDFSGPLLSDTAIDFGRLVQFWDKRFASLVLAAYSLPTDGGFRERAKLYAALEPLRTIAVEAEAGTNEWTGWARRKLATAARRAAT